MGPRPYFGRGGEEDGEADDGRYSKWDRNPYFAPAGDNGGTERRRSAVRPRQSGARLAEERKRHGLTQAQLAEAMGVTPELVSQIERGEVSTVDAFARYVQVFGGRLDLVASFGDYTLTVATVPGGDSTEDNALSARGGNG